MVRAIWIVALGGSGLGALVFMVTMVGAKSAPQEAAGAGMALALAVIPYVFARACQELLRAPLPTRSVSARSRPLEADDESPNVYTIE